VGEKSTRKSVSGFELVSKELSLAEGEGQLIDVACKR